jgi:4-aminobutyrate aminotransferase-like enzyme
LEKEKIIRKSLKHPLIKEIRGKGLMLTLITPNAEITNTVVVKAMEEGLILFWLLYEPKAIRITPPLTISSEELALGCSTILKILDSVLEDC